MCRRERGGRSPGAHGSAGHDVLHEGWKQEESGWRGLCVKRLWGGSLAAGHPQAPPRRARLRPQALPRRAHLRS